MPILVVEDDDAIADLIAEHLRAATYDSIVVGNGDHALKLMQERFRDIQLILSDIHLPGLNGAELARICGASWPYIPIVLYTGDPAFDPDPQLIELCFAILPKPFEVDQFHEIIGLALEDYESKMGPTGGS